MSFLRQEAEMPSVEEGDILEAKIVNMRWPVESKFQDADGTPRKQVEFSLALDNGFEFKCWLAYYERPSVKSKLGKLVQKLVSVTGVDYSNIDQFLNALKSYGMVCAQCTGYREYDEETYPKFAITPTKLPLKETVTPQKAPNPTLATPMSTTVSQETIEFVRASKSIIDMGLALNERDWNTTVPVHIRAELLKSNLVERKEGLYFFTATVAKFFQCA